MEEIKMKETEKSSVISVEGKGYIETEVNIIQINIKVLKVSKTIKESQNDVNNVIKELITFLKNNGVVEENIHTTSIDFGKHYEYEANKFGKDVRVYKGQRVSQSLIIIIFDLKNNIKTAINVLDNITEYNNSIELDVEFLIKDDKEKTKKCRELAYFDALEKAQKYAELANLKLIKAIKISENDFRERYSGRVDAIYAMSLNETNLPLGKIEKTMTLYVDFIAE
jgi:uncharacterized protein YggE